MITKKELQLWLTTVHDTDFIAVDDGGLTLVVLDSGGMDTCNYIDVGGTPEEGEDDERFQDAMEQSQ